VPYSIFKDIVDWTKTKNLRNIDSTDHFGHPSVPVELLILAALTILGRGVIFRIASMLTGISEGVIRNFYHLFCSEYAKDFYDDECHMPKEMNDVNSVLDSYALLGLPGCIGSTDCVHLAWDRCPAGLRNIHKGKEGYPTLAYSVTCTHSRRIINATKGFPGTVNDRTISRYDSFITSVRNDPFYRSLSFELGNILNDEREQINGVYLICDGGYNDWRCLQCPRKYTSVQQMIAFSKQLESVRKDVERTFGILKKRFYILRIPFRFNEQKEIDNTFFTCCILHNILLRYDARTQSNDHGLEVLESDGDVSDFMNRTIKVTRFNSDMNQYVRERIPINSLSDFSYVRDHQYVDDDEVHLEDIEDLEDKRQFHELGAKLANHFMKKKLNREVLWF
jgi:hypothetical protein